MNNRPVVLYHIDVQDLTAKRETERMVRQMANPKSEFKLIGNNRGLANVYNSLAHAFSVLRTKRGDIEAVQYRQLAKAIELDTQFLALPEFSTQENLSWLTSAFNQNRNVYESKSNSKANEETKLMIR